MREVAWHLSSCSIFALASITHCSTVPSWKDSADGGSVPRMRNASDVVAADINLAIAIVIYNTANLFFHQKPSNLPNTLRLCWLHRNLENHLANATCAY